VAAEKIVNGVLQGLVSALFVLPVARLIMGPIPNLSFGHIGDVLLITVLGAAAFSSLGLFLGTAIQPQQIGLMFGVILAPMIFFGCAYYPWRGLDAVPVVKYLVLLNPLVYVAEGLRGVMTPSVPHMSLGVVTIALVLLAAAGWMLGMRTRDMAALGQLFLQDGRWGERQLIPVEYVRAATQRQNAGGPPANIDYGYMWWVVPGQGAATTRRIFMASGYGGQLSWVHPGLELVVAITSDTSAASNARGQAVQLVRGPVFAAAQAP
jgi:CubicO group peptidase (beta-lactamase class C family)